MNTVRRQPGSSGRVLLALATLNATVAWASSAGAQGWFFDNFNGGVVTNRPTKPTVITLTAATTVTELITYHWNNGQGAPPGRIGLRARGGKLYGPFPAAGVAGQGNVQNAAWDATVIVTLPPGSYTVVDTDPATWAQNAQSGGMGFTRVAAVAPTAACVAPRAKKNVPYGGNCRTAGCEHPDLTAYGGNGPFGSVTTNRHVHGSLPQTYKFVDWSGAAVTTLAQRCTQMNGSLVLVDDEPWYYYFVGYYARFVCV